MISENKRRTRQDFWKEHSDAWKASGTTQVAYCAEHGISYQSFVYQHNRIVHKSTRSTVNFIEAKAERTPVNAQAAGLQLILPNGIRVGIASEANAKLLKMVLTIAGAITC